LNDDDFVGKPSSARTTQILKDAMDGVARLHPEYAHAVHRIVAGHGIKLAADHPVRLIDAAQQRASTRLHAWWRMQADEQDVAEAYHELAQLMAAVIEGASR
jgi:hypothetical protein